MPLRYKAIGFSHASIPTKNIDTGQYLDGNPSME